jgi:tetratricopeptide (TPR) repeat protein
MSWQNELDRTLHAVLLKGMEDRDPDWDRLRALVSDAVAVNPDRAESHFLAGVVEEAQEARGASAAGRAPEAGAEAAPRALPESPAGDASVWRSLGRLDAAARRSDADRVRALLGEPWVESAVGRVREGRALLRAAGRLLLATGEEGVAFDLYRRHLQATGEAASRKDAETLLNEVVRRADDLLSDGRIEDAAQVLTRLSAFAESTALDGRVRAKVDRKLGRAHQLAGRFDQAATCFRSALDRLPADDRYRAVLKGDLALAALKVRGTLDLLPNPDRTGTAEAEELLQAGAAGGEGESYNAIYTLAMLAFERGRYADAAERFGEADRLMREAHAKARIVHARARFFRGAALLRAGATGEALSEARDLVLRDVGAAALEPGFRDEILDLLAAAAPGVRIPGRAPPARPAPPPRAPRAPRAERPPPLAAAPPPPARSEAANHLAEAQRVLGRDPRAALLAVDRVFKSRPSFEEWFGAYRTRLVALLAIREPEEARRTYERFRAKLHERGRQDRVEALLSEADGPLASLLDPASLRQERVDLYEVMPGKDAEFAAECLALARDHAASGDSRRLEKGVALLREALARDGSDEVRRAYEEICDQARAAGVDVDCPSADAIRAKVSTRSGEAPRVIVVGGDSARAPQAHALQDLGRRVGFEGSWIPSGARPLHQTLAEVEEDARKGASAILIHHTAGSDLRASVRQLAQDLSIPVREIPYAGAAGVEPEVLTAVGSAL